MSASVQQADRRFNQQATWTKALRQYLFQRTDLSPVSRILEVGCGTGAVLSTLPISQARLHGLDIELDYLTLCKQNIPASTLVQGDAYSLPYASASFDLVYTHFLFLWLSRAEAALAEILRVTRPGGNILALAEPDYGGRIDYPDALVELGNLQTESLSRQGANVCTGRRLASEFNEAGLDDIQSGVLGGEWAHSAIPSNVQSEWVTLASDLVNLVSPDKLEHYRELDQEAWKQGSRVLFVPTFFASGRKPN
jgi:SAM-dependent methyltransferase